MSQTKSPVVWLPLTVASLVAVACSQSPPSASATDDASAAPTQPADGVAPQPPPTESSPPSPVDCEPAGATSSLARRGASLSVAGPQRASIASAEVLAAAAAVDTTTCDLSIDPAKQILITNLAVVNDPVRTRWTGRLDNPDDGAWHLGRLLTEIAGDQDPTQLAKSWLEQWQRDIALNGQVAPARAGATDLIAYWPKTSTGALDLTKAPFRLHAIVNRFDLRGESKAGEARLVYGLVDPSGETLGFMIILEYRVPAFTEAAALAWARQWQALGQAALGSAEYRSKLRALTTTFTRRGADPKATNGSALAQVRSNEFRFGGSWDLREFHLDATGQLRLTALARTPIYEDGGRSLNGTARLARYLRENAAAVLAQTHETPATFGCGPFAGIAVTNYLEPWTAPGITDSTLRHRFSLNTCNGCHGAETDTFFVHIEPRPADQEALLSPFLTGEEIADPVTGERRSFSELANRATILRAYLCANR